MGIDAIDRNVSQRVTSTQVRRQAKETTQSNNEPNYRGIFNRISNATVDSDRKEQLIGRLKNVIANQNQTNPPTEPPPSSKETSDREGPNYRGIYNRIINSNLGREEKSKFIGRLKNAVASGKQVPESEADKPEEDPAVQAGNPNYRGLFNRVVNSTLSREEKLKFVDRIKNAVQAQNEKNVNSPAQENEVIEDRRKLAEA